MSPEPTAYRTPELLQPIQLLDFLELGGTSTVAAKALGLSQPTVSRRTRHLVRDLGLSTNTNRQERALRYDSSPCLQLLRQACQVHRLEAGAWRVGSCPWQQGQLQSLQPWSSLPGQFRHPRTWRELVAAHAIDAAVVSGLDFGLSIPELQHAGGDGIAWEGFLLVPICRAELGLLMPPNSRGSPKRWSHVAVPAQQFTPGLASLVRQQQWQCLHASKTCHDPNAWGLWLRQHTQPALATRAWVERLQPHLPMWVWQPWPEESSEQYWLLVLQTSWQEQQPLLEALLAQVRTAMAGRYAKPE